MHICYIIINMTSMLFFTPLLAFRPEGHHFSGLLYFPYFSKNQKRIKTLKTFWEDFDFFFSLITKFPCKYYELNIKLRRFCKKICSLITVRILFNYF
ncbi:hypothetical protein ES288_A05G327100v1 [Gossypium darwinii]|nr:hypothetical protein ES288_A05G327100v1 [Gossypium darwinii]